MPVRELDEPTVDVCVVLRARDIVSISGKKGVKGLGRAPSTGELRVNVCKGAGDNGSSLVGTIAGRRISVMTSITNAAASPICGPVRVRPLKPYIVVSATNFSSSDRLNREQIRGARLTTRGASVTIMILSVTRIVTTGGTKMPFGGTFGSRTR